MSFSTYDDDEVVGDAPGFDTGDDDEEVTGPVASIYKTAYSRGVNPDFLIGLAKLETRMGEASVKGDSDSYNLFNIKDITGKGPRATDKAEGSRDAYRQYASYDDSANDLVDMLARKYPKALEAQTPEQFATALKQGGYATDPDYVNKVVRTIKSVNRYDDQPATDDAPEGMPNHVNLRALDAQMAERSAQAAPPTKAPAERTWREAATDTARSLTQGAIDVVGVLPGVAWAETPWGSYDNAWLNTARGMNEVIQDQKSDEIKARRVEMDKKLSHAEGFAQKIVAGFVEGLADPTLLADTLARSAPGMVAGGFAGKAAGIAADALGMTVLKNAATQSGVISQGLTVASAAPRVAGATAVGTSAIVQGSSVASDTYEEAMKRPMSDFRALPEFEQLAQEHGEEQAKSILAGKAATRAGMVATAASLVAQKAIPGGDSIEKMFLPSTMREVAENVAKTGALTKGMAGGVASQAAELGLQGAKVGLKESASEGAEEGFGAVAKDLELSRLGKDVNLSDSFAAAAGQGAAAGFAMGNVAGIRETHATKAEAIAADGARLREMAAQRQADITKAGTVDEAIKAATDAQDYTSQSIANQILQLEGKQEAPTRQAPVEELPSFTSQPQPTKLATEAVAEAVQPGPTFDASNLPIIQQQESTINGTQADQAIQVQPQEAPAEAAGSGQSAYPNQLDSGIKAEAAAQAQAAQDAGIRAEVARMREIMEARRQAEQQAAIEAMPNTSPAKQVTATSGTPVVEAPVKDLKLSTDVPQFKSDAGANGVVDKLDGKYDRALAAPIQVWQRTDGSMEVISGRHRLDLAQRSGEQTVPVQVHREVDGFTAAHATLLDTELNVKDGRGKVKDYVRYFQSISIERGEATQRGLLQTAIGRDAYTIANAGSDELIASHNASQLTDQAATQIAQAAPKNGALQAVGMRMVLDGKSTTQAVNTMAAVKLMAQERGGAETEDMFGFDDSSMRDAQTMAKIAGQEQAKVSNTLAAVRGAAKRPELAAKEGVNINDQAALAGRIQSLEKQKSEWSNWATNPELVAQIRSQMEPKSQSQPATTPASNAPTGAPVSPATESAPEIGIPGAVWSRGNGRIAGHYAVKVDGEVVGNYHEKPEAAVAEAKTFLANKEARAKDAANKDAAIGEIRTRLMDGGNATDNDIRRLGLRDGSSELKWFIPAAANAFGITSRAVRPYIKDLIRVGHTDMGTKIESVNPKKALQAIAAAIKPTQKSSTGTITEPAFDLTPTTPEQVKADEDRAASAVKAEAIAKQDSENKFKADAEVDDFRLTGSDRAVDVAEAAGQGSLFDAPTDAPTQAPTIEAALAHVDSDSTLNTLEKAKARAALRKGDIEPGDILPKAQESTSAPTQEVNNVDQNQGAIESAPSYKYTPAQKIDAPSVGAFNSANEHKANAFQRVKMLRQQVADGRTDRRVELIRAEHEHRSAILGVEQAKAQIEKDANKQGLTTIKPIQKSSTDAITEPPLTTRQTVRDAIAESLPKQARAIDRMIQRGETGKRGGMVVIESNTHEAIAKAYSEKTGRDYDAALVQLQQSADGKIQGFHDPQSGLSFVVAPNVTARTAAAVALHEAYHGQQREAIDTKAQALLDSADDKLHTKGTREVLAEARQKIADANETGNKGEAAAYIIEAAAQRGREAGFSAVDGKFMDWVDKNIGARVGGIIRDFVSMVRAHSLRIGLPINLHVDDLVSYAKIGLERAADGKTVDGDGVMRSEKDTSIFSTPAFKKWFGDSKVVDKDGKPMVMYHGTKSDFSQFDIGKFGATDGGFLGKAFYFTPAPMEASLYAEAGTSTGANVMPVYLTAKNPLEWKLGTKESSIFAEKRRELGADGFVKWAQDQGYDAVHLTSKDIGKTPGENQWAVFSPEQIKSATGNNGEFDGKNPDIRFSRSGGNNTPPSQQQPAALASPTWDYEGSKADKLIYELQDGRIDLKRVQESIKKSGQDINEKFDARLAETLYAGRVATRTDRFLQDDAAPLLEQMARTKVTMPELSDYLLARHAPERNAQIAKVNDKMPDGGAGTNSQGVRMTTQAATDYIANLPTETRLKMEALAQKVDAITKGTRDLLVSEGLEKQETIDAWNAAYKHYAPLFREDVDEGRPHSVGTGFSVRGDSSKRATGSDKKVDNMLAHVLMQREAAITRAEKNRVAMSLYGLALSSPNKDFWTTITPKDQKQRIMGELVAMGVDPVVAEQGMSGIPTTRTVDKVTGKVVDRINPLYKSLPGAITVRVNGEDRVLMFNQKDPNALRLAESLKNLDGLTKFDLAGTIVGKTTRWMAAANTQYNPAFGLVNSTRDSLGALVNLSTTPIKGKQLQVFGNMPSATKGIYSALRGDTSGQWAKLYEQFQMDGGQTGYKEMFKDVDARAKAIEKELSGYDKGALSPGKAAHAVLSVLDGFNTIGENVVRLSAYKTALDNGLSRPEAAKLARELTVDFNRKGRMGREIGPLYAFFNASVQGTARTLVSLKGPAGAKIIAGGIGLGVLQAVMLAAAGYDDDEVADWVKSRNFIIPLGKTESGEKKHIQIPLPLGLNALPNIGRTMVELGRSGGKDFGKKTVSAIGEVMASLNPVGGGTVFTPEGGVDWGGVVKTAVPTILDPVVELATNKGFSGTAIEKTYRDEADSRPGFQRAKEKTKRTPTGQMYLGITKALNNLTGGDDYEAGFISPSPEKIRYLAEAIGGGLLREIEKAVDLSMKVPGQKETKPSGIPFIGRFYGETDSDAVAQSRYYKSVDKAKSAESSINLAKAAGDGEAMRRIYEKRPEAKTIPLINRVQPKLAKLNKLAVSQLNDSENIKLIDDARLEWMKATNKAILELEAQ